MRTRVLKSIIALLFIAALFSSPVSAKQEGPWHPGDPIQLEQKIPVNLVFIGYDDMIDRTILTDVLPASYDPLVRYPQFYGLPGREMGLLYDFDYKIIDTDSRFDNRFFKFLTEKGVSGDLTDFQAAYNAMENNVLDVTTPVLYIDAPTVEKYLTEQSRSLLGRSWRDLERSYTIFFVNWYSRPDFQFHVYTKTDEPDPDTGYNFGEIRASRKMIAWGGTHGRTWFYDLSAGPESWAGNYDVDNPDLDGDGEEDYRIPPIWEYVDGGYREPGRISQDLGFVTRFVAINLLFTSSPLYDPLVTAPAWDGLKVGHIEMFEDDPASSGLDWIDPGFIDGKLRSFQPYYDWDVNLEDNDPIDPGAQRALRIFGGVLEEDDCWNDFGDPFAELFCYFDANLDSYVPEYDPSDYVAEVFSFNTTGENLGNQFGLLGFADDNWVDGTQTYVFTFGSEDYRTLGYGFSNTVVHEVGHHIGMSHPHDGYDSLLNIDYGPSGQFYFVWSGDESATVMNYLAITGKFGQFDRDNMYRWETAGYLNLANDLLPQILTHPEVGKVRGQLQKAEINGVLAVASFYSWNYARAASSARLAYEQMAAAADKLGISTESALMALRAVPTGMAPHEGDPIRFPNN